MKSKLLLLHGALGSKKQFAGIKELLADKFDVYDMNFEGHGGLDSDNDFSIQLFTENTKHFIENNGLEKVNIFGYSMGGYVALNTALLYPNLINKIITLGTKFDWNPTSSANEVKMLNPSKIKEKIPHFAEKLKQEHAPANWETVMKKTAGMMLNLGNKSALKEDDFKKIQHDVTIGIGSKDRMVSYEESENTSSLLANGKLVLLESVPHPIDRIDSTILLGYIFSYF